MFLQHCVCFLLEDQYHLSEGSQEHIKMSEPIYVVPCIGDVLANNFKLAWNAGSVLFTERKGTGTLRDAFKAARELCKSDMYLVQMTLNANEILLDRIIERNNSDFKAEEQLKGLGDDIAELIKFLNTK